MSGATEATKAELLRQAAALAEDAAIEPGNAAERGLPGRVVAALYEHVPPADVAGRNPQDLAGAALALWRFAAQRRPGEAKVRVYDPSPVEHGWTSPRSVVEIVNDDMPFLVDSVTGAINAGERVVHLVIHPIMTAVRDADGRLFALDEPALPGLPESWMQIEIAAEPDEGARAALAGRIAGVLADVRAAVADWQKMRAALHDELRNLTPRPAPVRRGDVAEAMAFLRWLDDDNFTFLGFREYRFDPTAATRPALGILRDANYSVFGGLRNLSELPPDIQEFIRRPELLVIAKTNRRGTVHRNSHMDAIGIRHFDDNGDVLGVGLFVGLFTSLAYSRDPRSIPLLRRKVDGIVARAGLSPASHDGKALLHILDTLPRDELLQAGEDELFDIAIGILNLQERQRIALFVRRDPLERFVSCLVYVPRERYDRELRQAFAAILAKAFAGTVSAFDVHLDDSVLARVHFIIRTPGGAVPGVDTAALEARLAEAGRRWSDRVEDAAAAAFGEEAGHARLARLKEFPVDYQARTPPDQAIADLDPIEAVLGGAPLAVLLHPRATADVPGLRLYRAGEPVALSDVLPMLENLGLRIVAEAPFRIDTVEGAAAWVHEFTLAPGNIDGRLPVTARARFAAALVAVWTGQVENDGFNRLVLAAGLSAPQIVVLRLYCKVLRQAGSAFSQAYMEDTLARNAGIARRFVSLFECRFDPARQNRGSLDGVAEIQAIDHALDQVESLDEDRILRGYLALILKTVRTNYFQPAHGGEAKPYLSMKLASHALDLLPAPRPLFEIYVYSPRFEGVHMRAGKVARGGIRWSDRKEDFRTEILGLMKAQTVKNAVIVPVGSKGGFVLKRALPDREALQAEGLECYRLLMRGLLDLTDNIVPHGPAGRRVAPPRDVVRHDEDDPYLVVAADKGTASFSDTANEIAAEYGYWLGDAFASGGSQGYDHKEMGITSRGAWELVKRHFRELGRDIQMTPFTVVGVGDMSGDVFGNGMLRSRATRLLGAFDHRHIFVDPDPDPEQSFAERRRLFDLPRSSWADYDRNLISPGGGVWERGLKSIPVGPEMKALFAIGEDRLTPAELIRRMLAAEIDLLWFGGIGTYVKARAETHAEVGDRANDALRVDGEALRAKVVGEGANLAVTQRGRIAYALKGGRIDTDAIDNSAGVDTSDHEVNIKILLDSAIAAGQLGRQEREPLLAQMTGDVAALVLRDNYLQGEALSVAEARSPTGLDRQIRVIRELERAGRLDRALEFLPDDETLAARAAAKQGLTRPELAVLLAYAKMSLDAELLASDLPDGPELADELAAYFPPALRERFAAQIAAHPLRRELIATILSNEIVNRAGPAFVHDLGARTGRGAPDIARSYKIVRTVFALPDLWAQIEQLDNKVAAVVQTGMLIEIIGLIEHAAAWLLRAGRLDIAAETARFGPAAHRLETALPELLPAADGAVIAERTARLTTAEVPAPLAARVAGMIFLGSAFEIADLAERAARPLDQAARLYFAVGAQFALDDMRAAARRLPAESPWQKLAVEATIDDLFALQADLTARVLASGADEPDPLASWKGEHGAALAPAEALATELRAAATPDLAMLVIAARQLRRALG
ncbi:MAG: NAD-glutamate dehydrogenase [Alphaproteobacteria bacterium]|nr:NAD-glutamate dehydrogenase [Alphaproteobacteria bacterium]